MRVMMLRAQLPIPEENLDRWNSLYDRLHTRLSAMDGVTGVRERESRMNSMLVPQSSSVPMLCQRIKSLVICRRMCSAWCRAQWSVMINQRLSPAATTAGSTSTSCLFCQLHCGFWKRRSICGCWRSSQSRIVTLSLTSLKTKWPVLPLFDSKPVRDGHGPWGAPKSQPDRLAQCQSD